MSKLARLTLLLATLWACYGGAAWLFKRQLPMFAQAAVLGGIAVYGASIMLISQMYHMEGSPPDAVLLWALGALLAAVLVPSAAALAATFVLIVVWTWWERSLSQSRALRLPGDVGRCRGTRRVDALATGPAPRRARPDHLAGADRVLRARPARALAGGADRRACWRRRAMARPPGHRSACARFGGRLRLRHRHRLRGPVHHAVRRLALVLQRRARRLARAAGAAGGDLHRRPARRHAVGAEDRQHGGAVARPTPPSPSRCSTCTS